MNNDDLYLNKSTGSDNILWDLWLSRLYLPALGVADKINIFQTIHNGYTTINKISYHLEMDMKGIEALVFFLTSIGLLNYSTEQVSLTNVAKNYLLSDSLHYWGNAFVRTHDTDEYKRVFTAITNTPSQLYSNGKNLSDMWKSGNLDIASAEIFTKVMHSSILPSAILAINNSVFADISHLLDVGGGSGCFSEYFVKRYPKSFATIFELPEVCSILKNNINNTHINICSGNFFMDSFPDNCDGVLLSNILHDWDIEHVKILLEKSFKVLPHNGKIFIHEMLLDEGRCSPITATAFNLLMYVNHGSQQFTKSQLFNLLEFVGFKNCDYVKTHHYYSLIIAQK
jgi:acetylserotonin N-methyltransferase